MTTQELTNGLIYGDKWHKSTITYSFADSRLSYELGSDYEGSVPVSDALKTATFEIFDYIGTLLNLDFVYVQDGVGDIAISEKNMPDINTLGYAYMPYTDTISPSGDVFISAVFSDVDFQYGGLGYSALMHEIGHALGLDHPFGSGEYPGVDVHDTVMSYNIYSGYDPFNYGYHYDTSTFTSYQSADILALQSIYGPKVDMTDDLYDLSSLLFSQKIYGYAGAVKDNVTTLYDYAGNDTISLQNISSSNPQYINLNPGAQSIVVNDQIHHYMTITPDTQIENLTGSSTNDTIVLNTLNNKVDGLTGFDKVYENNITTSARVDVFGNTIVVAGVDSGFDVLKNVEALYVDDSSVNLNAYQRSLISYQNDTEAEVGRLYLSVLDRVADVEGLNYWVDNLAAGQSINDVANSFVLSNEFTTTYANAQTNEAFINTLYQNVLFRNADADGLNYWEQEMNNGSSKADVVVSFSNSQEFIDLSGVYFENSMMVVL